MVYKPQYNLYIICFAQISNFEALQCGKRRRLQKILAYFESTDGVLCAVESVAGLLDDGTLGDDVKTEDWVKDPETRKLGEDPENWAKVHKMENWAMEDCAKNKILKNLKQSEFE